MTPEELDASLKAFLPASLLIEFTSGMQIQVKHPEAVRRHGSLYVSRATDHEFCFFSAASVARVLDLPQLQS